MPVQYPYDDTGENQNNRVAGEVHDLDQAPVRVFAPNHGPFYTENHTLVDTATNQPLDPETDYKLVALEQEATLYTGKEVCALVAITNPSVGNTVAFTYQVVGGQFSTSTQSIQDLIDLLQSDSRAVEWGQIINLPTQFPPSGHLHDINDVYGWQFVILALQDIRNAILSGDQTLWDQVYAYLDRKIAEVADQVTAVNESLLPFAQHMQDTSNPHGTTKADVGLSNLRNYGIATTAIAVQGTSNSHYMTSLRVREAIDAVVETVVADVLSGYDFDVTKESIGLGSVQNYPIATVAQARNGTEPAAYMTPALVREAINFLSNSPNGLATLDNNGKLLSSQLPTITKGNVGLSNVQNYSMSTLVQNQNMTAGDRYVSPAGVKDSLDYVGVTNRSQLPDHTQLDLIRRVAKYHIVDSASFSAAGVVWYKPFLDVDRDEYTLTNTGSTAIVQTLISTENSNRATRSWDATNNQWRPWELISANLNQLDQRYLKINDPSIKEAVASASNVSGLVYALNPSGVSVDSPGRLYFYDKLSQKRVLRWHEYNGRQEHHTTSPDGRYLAYIDWRDIGDSDDERLIIVDVALNVVVFDVDMGEHLNGDGNVYRLTWGGGWSTNPYSLYVAIRPDETDDIGLFKIEAGTWNITAGDNRSRTYASYPTAMAGSMTTILLAHYNNPHVMVIDPIDINSSYLFRPHDDMNTTDDIDEMAISRDGRFVAVVIGNRVGVWDTLNTNSGEVGGPPATWDFVDEGITSTGVTIKGIDFSPWDHGRFVTADNYDDQNNIYLWNISTFTGSLNRSPLGNNERLVDATGVKYSPDGNYLAITHTDAPYISIVELDEDGDYLEDITPPNTYGREVRGFAWLDTGVGPNMPYGGGASEPPSLNGSFTVGSYALTHFTVYGASNVGSDLGSFTGPVAWDGYTVAQITYLGDVSGGASRRLALIFLGTESVPWTVLSINGRQYRRQDWLNPNGIVGNIDGIDVISYDVILPDEAAAPFDTTDGASVSFTLT